MVPVQGAMMTGGLPLGWMCAVWFGLAMSLCALTLHLLLRSGWAMRLATDVPNHRSLHFKPIPRVGGWGVIPVSVALMLWAAPALLPISLGAAFLAIVSHFDDRGGLPARVRFLAHFMAVAVLVALFPPAWGGWGLIAVLVIGLVWIVNLYNFMDGADGLAGGMTLFGFLAYALAALPADRQLGYAALLVSGAAAGFLLFNFHPARIFLGDAGSIPLGFLAGGMGYWGWREGVWACWFPFLVFSPFIADASVTLWRRLLRGEKVWQAHREHYYQRMVRMGVGHARTASIWYVLMIAALTLALAALHADPGTQVSVLVAWVAILVVCGCCVDRRWIRFNQKKVSQ